MIQLTDVNKIYKGALFETHALKDINLTIQKGDFVVITGESGSGKTTLLNLLGGVDVATTGSIVIDGIDITSNKAKEMDQFRKQYISFVFQHFALMERYTVYENLEAPMLARNIKAKIRKEKINQISSQLGIGELMNQYPSQISGGQKQRVAIARTLVVDSPIVLADEPTGALDSVNTRNVMEIMRSVHSNDKITIIITHDPVVASYADYVIQLSDGQILR